MSKKQLTIGLFGFGCVGEGLYEVLTKTPSLNAKIQKICIKNASKKRSLPENWFTTNQDNIFNDPEINTIVELIDDAEAAFKIVKIALISGYNVVSANKKMIAEHFEELIQIQEQTGNALLYEAAVCASIPIIRNLEEYYDNDLLERIEGIVNGSTNYILSQIDETQATFQDSLKKAQLLGYAESNPVLDVEGYDAKYKLVILLGHAFGKIAAPDSIFQLGIHRLGNLELNYAREKNFKIKLIAFAQRNPNGTIDAYVIPKFVSNSDPLYGINDVFNAVKTKTFFSDNQFFAGKGAGAFPTASAVISDISALSYQYKYEYKKRNNFEQIHEVNDPIIPIFFRYSSNEIKSFESHFIEVSEKFQTKNDNFLIGKIHLSELANLLKLHPQTSAILCN